MIITDLDGTLLGAEGQLSPRNRAALEQLGQRGIVRVVATGRSPYSARRAIDPGFPIDYLICASGAAIFDWRSGALLRRLDMPPQLATEVRHTLLDAGLDFMVHHPVPDNHWFEYHVATGANPDFHNRRRRYAEFGEPGDGARLATVSQFLAVEPPHVASQYDALAERLVEAMVILATSPLDHASRWIEIFSPDAGKGAAAAWLASYLGLARSETVGVGNDYNDLDLLDWVDQPFVVANAPAELRARFETTGHHDDSGFALLIERVFQ